MKLVPRRFYLQRRFDLTGVSGTGVVAWGVEWPDGTCALRWSSDRPSSVTWNSIEDVTNIHGHDGLTEVVWIDTQ